ncbi:MAG: YlxR family protein [Clostridia bacterium]|nr:YlxR family protein [Clostridia bacterium]
MTEKVYPVRKCISCGEKKPKHELVRIVRTESTAIIDPTGKMNGRGCYICKDPTCVKNAKKGGRIERALQVKVPEEIYDGIPVATEEK